MGKDGVYSGAGLLVVGTGVVVAHSSSKAGKGWPQDAWGWSRNLEQIIFRGDERKGWGIRRPGEIMAREGVLEGRIDDAALEGPHQRSLRRGLTLGLDGTLQVGSQLLEGESLLESVPQAFERAGGRAQEKPVGTACDLGDGRRRWGRAQGRPRQRQPEQRKYCRSAQCMYPCLFWLRLCGR